ncbi:MAG TPA: PIN domain-containing protein [Candidatus Acidoferrales bacterium]|nr:PIN domain-containing protein [Candidatus Acidoferrales bacterium]
MKKTFLPTSKLPDILVADANVVLSATIGGRAGMVLLHPRAPAVIASVQAGDEVLEHLPAIARKRGLDLGILLPVLASLPLDWVETDAYSSHEAQASGRIKTRDEDDWHVVALALAQKARQKDFAIWTQDKDFEVSELPTLTTGQILDYLEGWSAK